MAAGDASFQLVRRTFGDDPTVVENGDPIGELVGLIEVLGGEQDRDPVRDQHTDAFPHRAAAARVEPRGGLVEEDHPRGADKCHGQVKPAVHSPRVGRHRLVRSVGHAELVENLVAPGPARRCPDGSGRPSTACSPCP